MFKCSQIKKYVHYSQKSSLSRADMYTNPVFEINNNNTEYVDSDKHFGYVMNSKFQNADDILDKRIVFTGQVNNILRHSRGA